MITKGIKTSEFWGLVLTGLFNMITALGIHLPSQNETSTIVCTIATNAIALLYAGFRTYIKATHPTVASPVWINPNPEQTDHSSSL
jgi:hypothetical protein